MCQWPGSVDIVVAWIPPKETLAVHKALNTRIYNKCSRSGEKLGPCGLLCRGYNHVTAAISNLLSAKFSHIMLNVLRDSKESGIQSFRY